MKYKHWCWSCSVQNKLIDSGGDAGRLFAQHIKILWCFTTTRTETASTTAKKGRGGVRNPKKCPRYIWIHPHHACFQTCLNIRAYDTPKLLPYLRLCHFIMLPRLPGHQERQHRQWAEELSAVAFVKRILYEVSQYLLERGTMCKV